MTAPPERRNRMITLTGRPPLIVSDLDWPVIALAVVDTQDVSAQIRVRRHRDGRSLVYGTAKRPTDLVTLRCGLELAPLGDVAAAILSTGTQLYRLCGVDEVQGLADACIARLPAQPLA